MPPLSYKEKIEQKNTENSSFLPLRLSLLALRRSVASTLITSLNLTLTLSSLLLGLCLSSGSTGSLSLRTLYITVRFKSPNHSRGATYVVLG